MLTAHYSHVAGEVTFFSFLKGDACGFGILRGNFFCSIAIGKSFLSSNIFSKAVRKKGNNKAFFTQCRTHNSAHPHGRGQKKTEFFFVYTYTPTNRSI